MDREILFRGKRTTGSGFVYGGLVVDKAKSKSFISSNNVYQNDIDVTVTNVYEVDPTTIGQFTGLLDKNGNMVFEGDIFTADEYPFVDEGKPNYYGVVEWIFAGFQYVLKLANTDIHGISDGVNEILEDAGWVEVIGNIHDKPELIK